MNADLLDSSYQQQAMTKLTCLPKSLCLWDYRVMGTKSEHATVNFNFLTEQGSISLGDTDYTVRKHGWLSGHWSLENGDEIFAEAQKPNPLFRSFDVTVGAVQLTVKACYPIGRSFQILDGDSLLGTIKPVHPLTRRAEIECSAEVPELVQLFSFWLAVITWRRQQNNNS